MSLSKEKQVDVDHQASLDFLDNKVWTNTRLYLTLFEIKCEFVFLLFILLDTYCSHVYRKQRSSRNDR